MNDDPTHVFGRMTLVFGILLAGAGLFFLFGPRLPGWIGRMPGDVSFSRGTLHVFIPFGTCLLLSLLLTAVFTLISWLRR